MKAVAGILFFVIVSFTLGCLGPARPLPPQGFAHVSESFRPQLGFQAPHQASPIYQDPYQASSLGPQIVPFQGQPQAQPRRQVQRPSSQQPAVKPRLNSTRQTSNILRTQPAQAQQQTPMPSEPKPQPSLKSRASQTFSGKASYYTVASSSNRTASGETLIDSGRTAAHRTLPFNSRVRVTNSKTGQSVVVRINDRGPFHKDRVIDLSKGAAEQVGLVQAGIITVRCEVLE